MTSSLKLGIAGLAVVGIGLGAYLVNSGLKGDKAQKASEPVKLASTDNGQTPAAPAMEEPKAAPAMQPVSAAPAPTTPVASTDDHTGHAASPAPLGVHSTQDTERTWRPKPLETSEAQPTTPAPVSPTADVADLGRTEEPAPSPSPATAAPSPSPDAGRMTLQEQSAATQPAKTDQAAAKPANAAPEKMTIHVVQAGDTFSGLAAKYLGSPKRVNLIEKANPKINPNRLYVGTKLKIPAAPEAPKAAPADNASGGAAAGEQKAKTVKAPPVDPAKAYTVKPGDSWASLASQHLGGDSNWTVLYEYNKERFPANARTLQPGMVIEIPSKAEVAGAK